MTKKIDPTLGLHLVYLYEKCDASYLKKLASLLKAGQTFERVIASSINLVICHKRHGILTHLDILFNIQPSFTQ